MQVLPHLPKIQEQTKNPHISAHIRCLFQLLENHAWITAHLQDREARSFLFHVFPFPVQVPADQKARCNPQLMISKEYVSFRSIKTPAWPQSMPSWFSFTFMTCRCWAIIHVKIWEKLQHSQTFEPTWCCIRTQSLFISVKFWSTNSTASMTVSASLWIQYVRDIQLNVHFLELSYKASKFCNLTIARWSI